MSKERMPKENFSPALRECMGKIEALLNEYDAMGLIVLQSPQHTEFKLHWDKASWSIFEWLPPDATGMTPINMKFCKARHAEGGLSMGALWSFRRVCKIFLLFFDSLSSKAESKMEIDNTMGDIHNEGRP